MEIKVFETREDMMMALGESLVIAEIGVFRGDFSKFIHKNLNPKELYLIDIFEGHMGSGDKNGENMVFVQLETEFVKLKNYFEKEQNVHIKKIKSFEFLRQIEKDFFDVIYVDADHEYNSVKQELDLALDKVKTNGFICGHDYVSPRFAGVVKAVNEFCEKNNLVLNYITKDKCPSYCIRKTI